MEINFWVRADEFCKTLRTLKIASTEKPVSLTGFNLKVCFMLESACFDLITTTRVLLQGLKAPSYFISALGAVRTASLICLLSGKKIMKKKLPIFHVVSMQCCETILFYGFVLSQCVLTI